MRDSPVRVVRAPCERGREVVTEERQGQSVPHTLHREESLLRLADKATWSRRANRRRVAGCILLAACGGGDGGGGGGGVTPPPPVDNSVSRVDVTPSAAVSLVSGATTTLVAAAYTTDNRALPAIAI